MSKRLVWTPRLVSMFWDGLATTDILEEMSFARLAGPTVLELIQHWLPANGTCLDFGGGSGHLVRLMCDAGIRTAALETSPRRAKATQARLSGQANFAGAIAASSRQQFEFVVCTEVIEHIAPEATQTFLGSLVRHIAPGGRLFLTTPFNENLLANHVYCPTCDHEFHRWQHMRSWQVSDIANLMQGCGLETEWIGVVGFDDPAPIRDFKLRSTAGEAWPWHFTDSAGATWPTVGHGNHIVYVGRRRAEPKMSLDDPERLIAAGLEKANALGAAAIAVVPSSMAQCAAPVVIVDDHTIDKARGLSPAPAAQPTPMIVFPGSIGLLSEATEMGRLPRTERALVFEHDAWRTTSPVPLAAAPRSAARRERPIARFAMRTLSSKRESLAARRWQPAVDTRQDAILDVLLAPGDFPFRMSHSIDGRVLIGIGGLHGGGAERQIVNTIEGLSARGTDVHLLVEYLERGSANAFYLDKAEQVAASISTPAATDYSAHPWAAHRTELSSVLGTSLVSRILSTAAMIKSLAPDVVQTSLDWTNITVGLAAVLAGVPNVFISGRNLGPQHFEFFQWFMYPAYQAMARHPNVHFMNNSEAGRDDYAAWLRLPRDKIRVLRNGLQADEFSAVDDAERAATRRQLGLTASQPVVVGAFRLSGEKRPLLWVDACAQIARTLPSATFLLCGVGNMQADIEARIRDVGIAERVRLLGSQRDIQSIFAAADVVLHTALQEGTPNTLIEAQAMGIPVVTTPAFGAAEAVEDGVTGAVVRDETAAGLAKAAAAIAVDPVFRHRCRTAGPAFITHRFGFDRMIDETLAAYADAGLGWALERLPEPMHYSTFIDLTDFIEDSGLCWRVRLPALARLADDVTANHSPVLLLENGVSFGTSHCPHSDIRTLGGGRYSHWGESLYFSTLDGSKPAENGRRYAVAIRRGAQRRAAPTE